MKNPMQKLRRFFVRTRTYKATAAQSAAATSHDDDDGSSRLSGAFIVVLFLHIIAVVGVFAFARIKENRLRNAPPEKLAPTAARPASPKTTIARSAPVKAPAPAPVATLAAVPPPLAPLHETPKAPAATPHTTHIVKEGETLRKIAFAYSASVPDFVSLNHLKDADDIHTGQSLSIPAGKTAAKIAVTSETRLAPASTPKTTSASNRIYKVQKGDTPLKIARDHGCTYDELMKLNNVKDPKKIQLGQELKIPVKKG